MAALKADEIARFRAEGYLVVAGAITGEALAALRRELDGWVAESREHQGNYGETFDHRHRFDLEAGHSGDEPRLRRVNNPAEVSEAYRAVTHESALADMVADLIGPGIKFHHCKINLKLPGAATRVGYHQDFSYTPHTNDDLVTALLMLDDMTLDNGCLMAVPGSHREGQVSLWQGDSFTGETPAERTAEFEARAVPVTGSAGDLCLMHTSLMHGSAANASARPRGLFITVYSAADAFPLCPSPLPNRFEGEVVRGEASRVARLAGGRVELPPPYRNTSFFEVQGQKSATPED
ncbi:MAG: phytanoyl-CoA dioxygenase family protein [Alphaproteobacteria bacterium]